MSFCIGTVSIVDVSFLTVYPSLRLLLHGRRPWAIDRDLLAEIWIGCRLVVTLTGLICVSIFVNETSCVVLKDVFECVKFVRVYTCPVSDFVIIILFFVEHCFPMISEWDVLSFAENCSALV